jgi:DnaK suppressor protein
MSYLNRDQLDELRRVLDQREVELRADLERESNEKRALSDHAPEVPDPGDASFVSLSIDLGNASMTRDFHELRAIEAARGRMDEGSYGECVTCGTDIPFERLQVQPTAERCAPCQQNYEHTHADAGRGATL